MKKFLVLCIVFLSGCHNYSANVGEVLGCTLAGNGCNSQGVAGTNGTNGRDGKDGQDGRDGVDGATGSSCSVSTVVPSPVVAPNGGARITCTDGTDALLLNGSNGTNAPPTPYTVTQIVKPCPNISGSFPEVLLVLQDRSILASASSNGSALTTRLALLSPGNYVTTDGRSCNFTVTSNTIFWSGGSITY